MQFTTIGGRFISARVAATQPWTCMLVLELARSADLPPQSPSLFSSLSSSLFNLAASIKMNPSIQRKSLVVINHSRRFQRGEFRMNAESFEFDWFFTHIRINSSLWMSTFIKTCKVNPICFTQEHNHSNVLVEAFTYIESESTLWAWGYLNWKANIDSTSNNNSLNQVYWLLRNQR